MQRLEAFATGTTLALPAGMEPSNIDRREFTRLSLLGMLSGVAITISGCGGGGGGTNNPSNPNPPSGNGDKTGFISANHGHTVTITASQLTAGGDLRLTLRGVSGVSEHSHLLDLTAAEVVSIRGGARVSKPSSNDDAHEHTVIFN